MADKGEVRVATERLLSNDLLNDELNDSVMSLGSQRMKAVKRFSTIGVLFAGVLITASTFLSPTIGFAKDATPKGMAAPPPELFKREPWPEQRVVLLLPLTLGPGWNLEKDKAPLILPNAEQKLQQALQRTGKFSTTQLHRYNPIFLRGMQEKTLTREQVKALIASPSLEAVQGALSKMEFDQPPLIAEFSMEEITTEAGNPIPSVRAQVTGKLYEANDPIAVKTVVVTSDPQPLYYARPSTDKKDKRTVYVRRSAGDRIIMAADNAFNQIAREFVKPLDDITLPDPPAGTITMPVVGGTGGVGAPRPVIIVPQDQLLGTIQTSPAPPAPEATEPVLGTIKVPKK